ncbi:HAMP domain-containing sensor histidine kinase [Mesorhizobium sp. LHD-90]|uniref:sensor histidine kinase n=1 Tax=Mesorhizobium sp. LHD-90 TaxID=3071414 RepID=UPI0027E18351|nr:HAMP domain-containing sensor histidine kinase [Mesorhizobium sp. LHD-90]MDQ6436858.1 HAMP domain-containing sensor histidine kinase [Mesorhizobium sp. LHD-90]
MSFFATRYAELKRAVADGCDRIVHPRMTVDAERAVQRRILGTLLVYPFLASIAAWPLLPAGIGVDLTLAFTCVAFIGCGLAALAVMARRAAGAVLAAMLALATVQIAFLIAAAGGLQSPLTLIAAALPVEAWLALRTRRALGWGVGAMAAVLLSQGIPAAGLFAGADAAAWQWLLPLAYAALLLPRASGTLGAARRPASESIAVTDEDRIGVRFAPNGDLLDIDAAARDLLGIDPDLLIGTGFFQRVHVADRVALLCALADLRDGADRRKVEVRLRLPAIQEGAAPFHRALALDLTQATTGAGIAGALRDNSEVADLRAALAAAREANASLEAGKTRFLAAVSHELRTPLNSIIGFSDMLLCEVHGRFADPRQRETVEIVREAGNHLLAVVNSILDVSKMEAGSYTTNPEPFRFGEAAELCTAMVRLQAEAKQVRLLTDIATGNGEVKADRRAVQQMLLNLLSNAIKFTPDGGEVSVGAKRIGSRLHFWVSDTGIGIAADDLNRIGQPFAQVQNDYTRQVEGTGLGLALVKGLVALHEGTMSIDSTFGKGTTVTIGLPIDGPAGANGGGLARLRGGRGGEDVNGTLRKAS